MLSVFKSVVNSETWVVYRSVVAVFLSGVGASVSGLAAGLPLLVSPSCALRDNPPSPSFPALFPPSLLPPSPSRSPRARCLTWTRSLFSPSLKMCLSEIPSERKYSLLKFAAGTSQADAHSCWQQSGLWISKLIWFVSTLSSTGDGHFYIGTINKQTLKHIMPLKTCIQCIRFSLPLKLWLSVCVLVWLLWMAGDPLFWGSLSLYSAVIDTWEHSLLMRHNANQWYYLSRIICFQLRHITHGVISTLFISDFQHIVRKHSSERHKSAQITLNLFLSVLVLLKDFLK